MQRNLGDENQMAPEASSSENQRQPISVVRLAVIMVGLVILGAMNFIMLKLCYQQYSNVVVDKTKPTHTKDLSFFANQGINFLYVIYGGLILYPRMIFTNQITREMRNSITRFETNMNC